MRVRDIVFLVTGGVIVYAFVCLLDTEVPIKVQGGNTYTIYPQSLEVQTNDSFYSFNSATELSDWIYLASIESYKEMSRIEFQNRVENFSSFLLYDDGVVEVYSVCPYTNLQYSIYLNRFIKENDRLIYYNDNNLLISENKPCWYIE